MVDAIGHPCPTPVFAMLCLAAVALPATAWSGPSNPADGDVVAVWSQFVPGPPPKETKPDVLPVALDLRVLLMGEDQSCDTLALTPVAPPSSPAFDAKGWSKRTPVNTGRSKNYSVRLTVCSYAMPSTWAAATVTKAGATVLVPPPGVGSTPRPARVAGPWSIGRSGGHSDALRMIGLGDSGCRGAPKQPCGDRKLGSPYTLPAIIDAALDEQPDLVVHTGDYRYFHEGEELTDDLPDNTRNWLELFFYPAQPLLLKAPWAFARGNHEECLPQWFGGGWFAFFGSGTTSCATPPDGGMLDPWHFDIALKPTGKAPTLQARFVMLDSSTAGDQSARFSKIVAGAIEATPSDVDTWWISHVPFWSVYYAGGFQTDDADQRATREAIIGNWPAKGGCTSAGGCVPQTFLGSHIHMLQHIVFPAAKPPAAWRLPQQWVVANGGVDTYSHEVDVSPCTWSFEGPDDGSGAASTSYQGVVSMDPRHGYVAWTRSAATAGAEPSGWSASPAFIPARYEDPGVHLPHPASGAPKTCTHGGDWRHHSRSAPEAH